MLSKKFKDFSIGKKIEDAMSKPYDRSEIHKDALSFSMYSLTYWEMFISCISREFLLLKRNYFVCIFKTGQISIEGHAKSTPILMEESYEDEEDEHGNTLFGSCGGNYTNDEFWICCDVCERCYHGKCGKITPAKVESIKQYKCPSSCTKKGSR